MSATVLYMSMSLDGFIAGPNEGPGNGLGDGGPRLHEWLFSEPSGKSKIPGRPAGVNGQIFDEFMATGAVVAGRGPSSRRAAGAATTTTACRSSSSAAMSPTASSGTGRWSPTCPTSRPR